MEREVKYFIKAGIALLSIFLLSGCGANNNSETEMETEVSMVIENENTISIDGCGDYKWGTSVDEVLKNNDVLKGVKGIKSLMVKEIDEEGHEWYSSAYEYIDDEDTDQNEEELIRRRKQEAEAENKENALVAYYEADQVRLGLYKMNASYIFEDDKLTAVVYKQDYSSDNLVDWEQSGLKEQYILKYGYPSCSFSQTDGYGTKGGIDIWRDDNKNIIMSMWSDNEIQTIAYLAGGSLFMRFFTNEMASDDCAILEYINDGILDYGI